AANEVAVEAFLDGRLAFTAIPALVGRTLEAADDLFGVPGDLAEVRAADAWARERAAGTIGSLRSSDVSPHDDNPVLPVRPRCPCLRPRAWPLSRGALVRSPGHHVFARVRAENREGHARRDRVLRQRDPAWRLREAGGRDGRGQPRRRPRRVP